MPVLLFLKVFNFHTNHFEESQILHPFHIDLSHTHQLSGSQNQHPLPNQLVDIRFNLTISVFLSILKISRTCFSKFCMQFIKMLSHSRDFNPSAKGSSLFTETSKPAELSKLPSRSFFDASSSFNLLHKSYFLIFFQNI